jgi:DNA polymerase (family 10)
VDTALVAGSVRRRKETIGDIDILATSSKPAKIMERFLALPEIAHVYSSGKTKTMVKLRNGIDADLRVIPKISFGAALNYFTGSKEHNIYLREEALKKGYKLNEYGLFRGKKLVASKTEGELYKAFGMDYIEPELREMTGEIEAALRQAQGKPAGLPKLIGYGDLRGDLQVQTNWSDGRNSIEEYAEAAEKAGLEYIVITDHTKALAMTGGSDKKKLAKQAIEIDKINKKRKKKGLKLTILKGAEVNIMKDGSLDIADEALAKLDVVGAAIHHYFKLPRAEQTKRVIKVMENPHVDIIFHLTTRKINQRDPIDLDIDAIIKTAKRTNTILEIDAFPDRLDIKGEYIKKCVEAGVKMSIDSDAHSVDHFKLLEHGIAQARRGWAERKDIINAWPLEKMLEFLK